MDSQEREYMRRLTEAVETIARYIREDHDAAAKARRDGEELARSLYGSMTAPLRAKGRKVAADNGD